MGSRNRLFRSYKHRGCGVEAGEELWQERWGWDLEGGILKSYARRLRRRNNQRQPAFHPPCFAVSLRDLDFDLARKHIDETCRLEAGNKIKKVKREVKKEKMGKERYRMVVDGKQVKWFCLDVVPVKPPVVWPCLSVAAPCIPQSTQPAPFLFIHLVQALKWVVLVNLVLQILRPPWIYIVISKLVTLLAEPKNVRL